MASTYGKSKRRFSKKAKKDIPHYITKEDQKAKNPNQSWADYFKTKLEFRKLRNKNKNKSKA